MLQTPTFNFLPIRRKIFAAISDRIPCVGRPNLSAFCQLGHSRFLCFGPSLARSGSIIWSTVGARWRRVVWCAVVERVIDASSALSGSLWGLTNAWLHWPTTACACMSERQSSHITCCMRHAHGHSCVHVCQHVHACVLVCAHLCCECMCLSRYARVTALVCTCARLCAMFVSQSLAGLHIVCASSVLRNMRCVPSQSGPSRCVSSHLGCPAMRRTCRLAC